MDSIKSALVRSKVVTEMYAEAVTIREKMEHLRAKFMARPTLSSLVAAYPLFANQFCVPQDTDVMIMESHDLINVRRPSREESRTMTTGYGTDLIGDVLVVKVNLDLRRVSRSFPQPEDSDKPVWQIGERLEGRNTIIAVLTQHVHEVIITVTIEK